MPKMNVSRKRGKAKIKITDKRKSAMDKVQDAYSEDVDVQIAVIQELIPLGLQEVGRRLQEEVKQLAGKRHERKNRNTRWGWQNGSVYLRDQKFPISVPRVRNREKNKEVPLRSYEKLQKPYKDDDQTLLKLLHGLSTHKYKESSALAGEAIGLSASSLSQRFKEKSTDLLKRLQQRPLNGYDIVAIFVDGKRYAGDGLMVAMGITLDGQKIMLGVEHLYRENSRAIGQWFEKLIDRGLKYKEGLLFITDGSKGIKKAMEDTFGEYCVHQRCRWHKRENVISYLNDSQAALCKQQMQEAYAKPTYQQAKEELEKLHEELLPVNESAAGSLIEGFEETLTLHRLGLSSELQRSLGTTNCIESVMSQIAQYTDKVDRWHNSNQILRWTAASLLDIEPRLYRIQGCRYLKMLRIKLLETIEQFKEKTKKQNYSTSESSMKEKIVQPGGV